MSAPSRISVVGLGYVGLPLAVALARHFRALGYDRDGARIAELRDGVDRTREVGRDVLRATTLEFADDAAAMAGSDVFIITVPTPVDENNRPDLTALRDASRTVGEHVTRGAIVVVESTVYPGVTEEICGPVIESASGLTCGEQFFLGYSPERINPGDREHTVERITKVVAGQTAEVTERLAGMYGAITSGGVFVARDIKTAEAAKVIENAQRDINIAFVNEVTYIFHKMGLSAHDVLDAAMTKWNFLDFRPGLVGGHCIGVDPFYLAHRAKELGHEPEIVLAGRRINDRMGLFVAEEIAALVGTGRALVLGLTFKENVPDLRNTKVFDVVRGLGRRGLEVDVHDPHADAGEAMERYGVALMKSLDGAHGYDVVVGTVAHDEYLGFTAATFERLAARQAVIADVRGMWRDIVLPEGMRRWQL
ncbi:MAG: nucleotide sugar dehydrogenase [Alphaproteobacteria bacterium]